MKGTINMALFKFYSGSTYETNICGLALKDEIKLCKRLAKVTDRYRRNDCTYGELDQARADLINHLIFMRDLENDLIRAENRGGN